MNHRRMTVCAVHLGSSRVGAFIIQGEVKAVLFWAETMSGCMEQTYPDRKSLH